MTTALAGIAGIVGAWLSFRWLRNALGDGTANAKMLCKKLKEIALSYDGVGAQKSAVRFCALVAPNGPKNACDFFLRPNVPQNANSSCGVVAVGFMRELARSLGLKVPELEGPMVLDWWTPVVNLAKRHGAYHLAKSEPGSRPQLGAIVHVATGNAQHWYTIVDGDTSGAFTSVDGGKQDAQGYQLIGTANRKYGPGLLDLTSQKPVTQWVDVPALFESLMKAAA